MWPGGWVRALVEGRYDRARDTLDRNAAYALTAYLAGRLV